MINNDLFRLTSKFNLFKKKHVKLGGQYMERSMQNHIKIKLFIKLSKILQRLLTEKQYERDK